jgi:iron-sulfur cluster assembly protein
MITISPQASAKILALHPITATHKPIIRVAVSSGGCSGLSYALDFAAEMQAGDQVFEDQGVQIAIDKKSFFYLIGTQLEYSDGLQGKGFYFNNPNAARTCSCGESFSL